MSVYILVCIASRQVQCVLVFLLTVVDFALCVYFYFSSHTPKGAAQLNALSRLSVSTLSMGLEPGEVIIRVESSSSSSSFNVDR